MKNTIKQNKLEEVTKLTTSITGSKSVVFVDYTGMDMKTQQGLMNELKANNSQMIVSKNTLIKIAAKSANLPDEAITDSVLSGQTAMVIGTTDPVSPLQILGKFMKLNEKPKWKAGVIEGMFQDASALDKISKLPGKDQLVSQVIGSLSGPLYGLVGTLNGNISKLVYILSQKVAQG